MASKTQALFLLFSLFAISSILNPSLVGAGQIAIYWGQNGNETSLQDTCAAGYYEIVLLAFLNVFGANRTPSWNFAGHCGDWNSCTKLAPEIQYCQNNNVKVLLSVGGALGNYSIASAEDAANVSQYLWENFLSGQYGPLGDVSLDGIDLDIESSDSTLHWEDLASELYKLKKRRNIYLSAAPQCVIPDRYLDTAIRTGYFDYVFVQFYNNYCQFTESNPDIFFQSWDNWTKLVPSSPSNGTLFLGLPAAPEAAPSGGFISVENMKSTVLPYVKKSGAKYGGVMLWNRYYDIQSTPPYSKQIKPYVLPFVVKSVTTVANAIYKCVSDVILGLLPPPQAL